MAPVAVVGREPVWSGRKGYTSADGSRPDRSGETRHYVAFRSKRSRASSGSASQDRSASVSVTLRNCRCSVREARRIRRRDSRLNGIRALLQASTLGIGSDGGFFRRANRVLPPVIHRRDSVTGAETNEGSIVALSWGVSESTGSAVCLRQPRVEPASEPATPLVTCLDHPVVVRAVSGGQETRHVHLHRIITDPRAAWIRKRSRWPAGCGIGQAELIRSVDARPLGRVGPRASG